MKALLVLLLLCAWMQAQAQTSAPISTPAHLDFADRYFETVGDSESIPDNNVNALAEDAQGLIWIGTPSGLVRYDGYRFKLYTHNSKDATSLGGNLIRALSVAGDGRLWVGTDADGVSVFDSSTETFTRFRHQASDATSLTQGPVRALAAAPDGGMWVGTWAGLNYQAAGQTGFVRFPKRFGATTSELDDRMRALLVDKRGALIVGSWNGLSRLAAGASHFERLTAFRQTISSLPSRNHADVNGQASLESRSFEGESISSLYQTRDGQIAVGTMRQGSWLLDLQSNSIRAIPKALHDAPVNAVALATVQPNPQEIWLASFGGLELLDATPGLLQGLSLKTLRPDPSVATSLAHAEIRAMLQDQAGWIWLGGQGGGLQRVNPSNSAMRVLHHSSERPNSLSAPSIGSILELSDGTIWFGTRGNGIDIFDRKRGQMRHLSFDAAAAKLVQRNLVQRNLVQRNLVQRNLVQRNLVQPDKLNAAALSKGDVFSFAEMPDQSIWVGTSAGLFRIEAGLQKVRAYAPHSEFRDSAVRRLLPGVDGLLWIGTREGLFCWSAATDAIEPVKMAGGSDINADITALALASDGRLWVGSLAGLHSIDPNDSVLRDVAGLRNGENLQPGVLGLLLDSKQRLWVDTNEGLNLLTRSSTDAAGGLAGEFDPVSERLGIGGEAFGANLLEDARGRIWTQKFVLDADAKSVYELGKADGVEFGTAWFRSYTQTADGLMWFGGSKGVLIVDPAKFQARRFAPPLIATALKVAGKSRPIGSVLGGLVLAPGATNFSLEFAALDYAAPQRVRYRYQLRGFDADWIDTDAGNRVASYTNLAPGNYTLEVRSANRMRESSPHALTLEIRVLPAFWQTGWFLSSALIVLALTALGVYRGWRARLRSEAIVLQKLVAARTADILKLAEIGKELTATLDTEQAFDRVYRRASARLDTYVFSVGIYDQNAAMIYHPYSVEAGRLQTAHFYSMSEIDRPAVWCVRERRELITTRQSELVNFVATILPPKYGLMTESVVYLPLIIDQRVIGCLSAQSLRKNAYSTDQLEFLRALASYTAIAIANSRAHGELSAAHGHLAAAHQDLAAAHEDLAAAHLRMKQTQQHLALQDKMAGLGTLTAGVAHEINNPTNFVHVAAQNLRVDITEFQKFTRELVEADDAPEVLQAFMQRFAKLSGHVNTMLHGTERIKAIVKDLRAFTRSDQTEKTNVRISECLSSTLNLVRSSWLERVEFVTQFIDDPEFDCWPALLNQVFMNLLVNGCQAIAAKHLVAGERGQLRITLQMKDAPLLAKQLHIAFSDNGVGMSESLQARILEPFFTTKAIGEGTGLGLSISYGIILQHCGELQINSTLGLGSCFTVVLPLPTGDSTGPDSSGPTALNHTDGANLGDL